MQSLLRAEPRAARRRPPGPLRAGLAILTGAALLLAGFYGRATDEVDVGDWNGDRRVRHPVLHGATLHPMRTISQRELRNDNAQIMRGVEEGETYTVTRRGVPVARLTPIDGDTDLRRARPAKRRPVFSEITRVTSQTSTAEILSDLRGER